MQMSDQHHAMAHRDLSYKRLRGPQNLSERCRENPSFATDLNQTVIPSPSSP
jgi:hypothetical protein